MQASKISEMQTFSSNTAGPLRSNDALKSDAINSSNYLTYDKYSKKQKSVLMIALEFAPVSTTGAFRSIAFARHLDFFGYAPHVISIDPEEACCVFGAKVNSSLLDGIKGRVRISSIQSSKPLVPDTDLRRFLRIYTKLDDTFYSRYRRSLFRLIAAPQAGPPIQAVIASLPPFGAARLGEMAAHELGVPLSPP